MLNPTTRVVGFLPTQTLLAVLSFRALALRAKERSACALRPVACSAKCVVQSSREVHGVIVAGGTIMEDGILYLAARYYAAGMDSIRAAYEPRIEFARMYPDCEDSHGFDIAERDLMLSYFRCDFPYEVVDAVEGVDEAFREWDEEDRQQMWDDDDLPF